MLQLQIQQVTKHFAMNKQRSDTSSFDMLYTHSNTLSVGVKQMAPPDCAER